MEKKGLCITCVKNKECILPTKFPVWQCEEFSDYEPRPKDFKKNFKQTKIQKVKVEEEESIGE